MSPYDGITDLGALLTQTAKMPKKIQRRAAVTVEPWAQIAARSAKVERGTQPSARTDDSVAYKELFVYVCYGPALKYEDL